MQIISNADETILKILNSLRQNTTAANRLSHYCVQTPAEEGTLLFNTLTRELVLLSAEEYANLYNLEYLKEHWFLVPQDLNEKEFADLAKWFYANKLKKTKDITTYTIFPTTDCNARCFYCFELGRSRIPMTEETAHKVVEYITNHCGGQPVKISWFGGEPLYNAGVIDTICDGLRVNGVEYNSSMVSNGYLFDAELVEKAVNKWNMKWIQITLDGTEEVYNRVKAFIYKDQNPYQVVLNNIERLLDASITVHIRLNMDMHNADNLLELIDELTARFSGKKGLSVYAHHLFDGEIPMAQVHTDEEWLKRDAAMYRIEQKIAEGGFDRRRGITKRIRLNHCMADSGKAVTILPDGNIGLCEQFSETEFVGHIDRDDFDQNVVASWKERIPEIPECAECFFYPECIKIKKCSNESECYSQFRRGKLRETQRRMVNQYTYWKNNVETEDVDDAESADRL
ncbi:MAG: 4Fe-4S cluster-binding domain-containing protein [Ruminococcaceae bacterium]|nr:4Fe-4S cluster-binding domain-containing protein [Oscillospiraceae bacterium]